MAVMSACAACGKVFSWPETLHPLYPTLFLCSTRCALEYKPKRNKYGNRRGATTGLVEGRRFDSQHEADVAGNLVLMERAGEIRNLRYQVSYDLRAGSDDELICRYVADFVYSERRRDLDTSMGEAWVEVVADAKSAPTRTAVYRLKKKLMAACYFIHITEL